MKAAEASATHTNRNGPARRWFAGLRQRLVSSLRDAGGSRPICPIELAAVAIGIAGAFMILDSMQAWFAAAWWLLALVVVRSDLADFQIPDEASIAIALLGLAQVAATAQLNGEPAGQILSALAVALAGGLAAAGFLWTIGHLFRRISGRDGLGFGDVKLIGASGIWLGPLQQAVAIEFAALAALTVIVFERWRGVRDRGDMLPFGAFLAPAAWLVHVVDVMSPGLLEGWS